MSDIRKIIAIAVAAFIGVVLLITVMFSSLTESTSEVGLSRPNESVVPSAETEEDRANAYENRDPLPSAVGANLEETVASYLTRGDFSGLDSRLSVWAETYREDDDDALAEMGEIDRYRADIAFYTNLINADRESASLWQFNNPNVLAACVAYAPISSKYKALISHNSAIMAPALTNISLSRADLSAKEMRGILDSINLSRSEGNEFHMIAVYEMVLYGYECQFIAVSDVASMKWQPYSLMVKGDSGFSVTAQLCYDLKDIDPSVDLDAKLAFMAVGS